MLGLFTGCTTAPSEFLYKPDATADAKRCLQIDVTEAHIGAPLSPSVVTPDSHFVGTAVDDQTRVRVAFESLTGLRPELGERWKVHIDRSDHVVRAIKTQDPC